MMRIAPFNASRNPICFEAYLTIVQIILILHTNYHAVMYLELCCRPRSGLPADKLMSRASSGLCRLIPEVRSQVNGHQVSSNISLTANEFSFAVEPLR
jgi:hypothetical protein